jgi:hypothetical protein
MQWLRLISGTGPFLTNFLLCFRACDAAYSPIKKDDLPRGGYLRSLQGLSFDNKSFRSCPIGKYSDDRAHAPFRIATITRIRRQNRCGSNCIREEVYSHDEEDPDQERE